MFLMGTLTETTSSGLAALYQIVLGLGLGLVIQVLVLAVQSSVRIGDLGAATSATSFFRSIGGSVGVSVFATLFNAALNRHLHELLPAQPGAGSTASSFRGSPAELAKLPPEIHSAYVHSFVLSLEGVFRVAIIFAVIGFIVSLLLPGLTLRTTSGMETSAEGGGLAAVGQQFGLVAVGKAAVAEEIQARLLAADVALRRIDALEETGQLSTSAADELRRLYTARVGELTAGVRKVKGMDERAEDAARWDAALDLLRMERAALTDATPPTTSSVPVEQARAERDRRVAALRSVQDRVNADPSVKPERANALRALIDERIGLLSDVDAQRLGAADRPEDSPLWTAISDVLVAERQALRDLEPALSPDTSARLERDEEREQAELAGAS
jgi:hypothetical protein